MLLKCTKIAVQNRMYSAQVLRTKIGLLGIPYCEGTTKKGGTELAPSMIRQQGLTKDIIDYNEHVDIKDFGDLDVNIKDKLNIEPTNMLHYTRFMPLMKRISEKVAEIRADNCICITLGGDHAIAVGTISGQLNSSERLSVLYIDAHADINTNKTSRTGHIHGMPVALIVKELSEYWGHLPGSEWMTKKHYSYIAMDTVKDTVQEDCKKFIFD